MNPAEIISRLEPSSVGLDLTPKGFVRLTAQDVAYALGASKIPEGARDLLRVKYSLQYNYRSSVSSHLYIRLSDVNDFRDWMARRSHRPGLIMDMCKMAVSEYCRANICETCKGTGSKLEIDGKLQSCPGCGGNRIRPIDRKKLIREYLEISPSTFYYCWDDLYRDALGILSFWESVALSAVHHRLA